MKRFPFALLLLLFACKTPVPKAAVKEEDVFIIDPVEHDTIGQYSKDELNKVPDDFRYAEEPDISYSCNIQAPFNSEAGQDDYYVIYAHLLKKQTGEDKYVGRRDTLIRIYRTINSLFGRLNYGGTFFGHQYKRILGYAEYAVYCYSQETQPILPYDIKKLKELYIQSLRLIIKDGLNIEPIIEKEVLAEREHTLNQFATELDSLITDNFYLQRAQEFHYRYYALR